jgi:hypothetical protein
MLAESSIIQRLDDPAVALCVLVMAGAGLKLGGFRTTLIGFGLLLSLDAALALCGWVAGLLTKVEVPPAYATVAAFLVLFLAGTAATVGAMQAFLRDSAARLPSITDGILGALAGVLAGIVIAATLHIGWSMGTCQEAQEVPAEYRFDPEGVEFKVGEAMLANVAGVSNSLAKELVERYRLGLWVDPLPVPEPDMVPEEDADADADAMSRPAMESADEGPAEGEASGDGEAVIPGGLLPTLPEGGLTPTNAEDNAGSQPNTGGERSDPFAGEQQPP